MHLPGAQPVVGLLAVLGEHGHIALGAHTAAGGDRGHREAVAGERAHAEALAAQLMEGQVPFHPEAVRGDRAAAFDAVDDHPCVDAFVGAAARERLPGRVERDEVDAELADLGQVQPSEGVVGAHGPPRVSNSSQSPLPSEAPVVPMLS